MQPPRGGLDAAQPVGAFGVDDPQPDELREDGRVAFLGEPQHSRRRGPDRGNEVLLLAVLSVGVLRQVGAVAVLGRPTAAA
ncbi:hypothetical protein OG864_00080 [Streptomyces sp. NBC_00124]|uniref:hypothetical protein n=1 Tax=Streptomyces sp. NBC_00124 TaxID=2975662 RepID=UPI0022511AE8|nr:hypothetical protein [Streptomyces sp. NBC_00124]MCX5357190.1 hypothetical protein [Streptomyces sp. NBC_00124]